MRPSLRSGAVGLTRELSSGTATFGTQKEMWPISEPMPKISSKLQVRVSSTSSRTGTHWKKTNKGSSLIK